MISKIDINNFGSFQGFNWNNTVRDDGRNVQNFKKLNIIYGRNYSGKTTFSRIFRALQTGRTPLNYSTPSFTIHGDMGEVNQSEILSHSYDVRVYNRDFVTENLSFLVNQVDGEIKTFAIVGEENKKIEEEITQLTEKLGSVESKSGLKYELEEKRKENMRTKDYHDNVDQALSDKLRVHANEKIKRNREYEAVTYNIESIKKDIAEIKRAGLKPLTEDEKTAKMELLKEEILADISNTISIRLKFDSIKATAEGLLQRTITLTQPIQELLNDSILQSWVKSGVDFHKNKRDTCGFCRQELPHDIWQVLDSHFNKESSDLELEIDSSIALVNKEIERILTFLTFTKDKFYFENQTDFETNKKSFESCIGIYKQDLETLRTALETRKNNIFQIVAIPIANHDEKMLEKQAEIINALIEKNNKRTKTLDQDKETARNSLRLSDVASFINTINYDSEIYRIDELKTTYNTANIAIAEAEKEITKLENEIIALRKNQEDEQKGADRVNELLNHFFGHDSIRLEAQNISGNTAVKFQIMRDGQSAYNLSEGECSLIAFCYFIAKLEEPASKDKELIIYIDDPISSLDSNHIFFIFSLIESLIAQPVKKNNVANHYNYKQLFISTHNLDFLKYLKKISQPKDNNGGVQHFIIERNGSTSEISLLPSYLKDYVTEFNYLFHQIYKCNNQSFSKNNHEALYSFGNNLRKFLEAFLFFKYPYHDDKNDGLEKIKKFFGNDGVAVSLANRLNNELSHLESAFDRSMKPIEISEIQKIAKYVLDKIYAADPCQYNALLKSIGEPERIQ